MMILDSPQLMKQNIKQLLQKKMILYKNIKIDYTK